MVTSNIFTSNGNLGKLGKLGKLVLNTKTHLFWAAGAESNANFRTSRLLLAGDWKTWRHRRQRLKCHDSFTSSWSWSCSRCSCCRCPQVDHHLQRRRVLGNFHVTSSTVLFHDLLGASRSGRTGRRYIYYSNVSRGGNCFNCEAISDGAEWVKIFANASMTKNWQFGNKIWIWWLEIDVTAI
jgi:hypothetical protein